MDILPLLREALIDRLDYTLAYMSVTLLLYFYGNDVVRRFVRFFRGSKLTRFIIFLVMVFFGVNILLLLLVNFILGVVGWPKWIAIAALMLWAFWKFDRDIRDRPAKK